LILRFFLILHFPNPYLYTFQPLKNEHFAKIIFVLYALQTKGFQKKIKKKCIFFAFICCGVLFFKKKAFTFVLFNNQNQKP